MGGHRGIGGSDSGDGAVRARQVVEALEEWPYSARPSAADAVARRLSTAIPDADVRRRADSSAADVLVDGVPVLVADALDLRLRRDVRALAEGADEVVVYATSERAPRTNSWSTFRHRCRRGVDGATIRFVRRRDAGPVDEPRPARALATIGLSLLAICGLLIGSLGLFAGGSSAGLVLPAAVGLVVLAVGTGVAVAACWHRLSIALLKLLPH